MGMHGTRLHIRRGRVGALLAATGVAVVACCSASAANDVHASVPSAGAAVAQSPSEDPCRYITAQDMTKAFGRPLKSARLSNACQYQGPDGGLVIVKVSAGPEGVIIRHVRNAVAQGHQGAEKVASAAGEAYFESILPAFIGRVGNHDVQIESTIEPAPREAMIAVGRRVMETLPRR